MHTRFSIFTSRKTSLFFLIVGCTLFSSHVLSQINPDTVNTHLFRFSSGLETVAVEDALGPDSELVKRGRLFLSTAVDYVEAPLVGISSDRTRQTGVYVNEMLTASVGLGLLLSKRFYLHAQIPYHLTVDIDQALAAEKGLIASEDYAGLGDVQAKLKIRLTGDGSKSHVALIPFGSYQTSDNPDYLISDGESSYGLRLAVDRDFGFMKVFLNFGYSIAEEAFFRNIDRTRRLEGGLGVYLPVTSWLGVNAEWVGATTFPEFESDQNPYNIYAGLRARLGSLFLFGGLDASTYVRDSRSTHLAYYAGAKYAFWKCKSCQIAKPAIAETTTTVAPQKPAANDLQEIQRKLDIYRDVKFETASALIKTESYVPLNTAASLIKLYIDQISMINVEGHTDSRGSHANNQILSQNRAASVRAYLVSQGVPAAKLRAVGFGETRPLVPETTPENLATNRRVEFKVVGLSVP
jgi:outer membrane protein OmpA-like peptidoglycan-associated protein